MVSHSDSALALAAHGFRVFPLKADSKLPAVKAWPDIATDDAETIRALWADMPAANVGIYTNAYRDRHMCVVDIDMKNGNNGLDEFMRLADEHGGDIPVTRTVISTTGGIHLYFTTPFPIKSGAGELAPGIDTRGSGGYVVAPGATLGGKSYVLGNHADIAECPEWLLKILPKKTDKPKERSAAVLSFPVNIDAATRRAVDYLENQAPLGVRGARDTPTYVVACKVKDFGLDESACLEVMLEHWNDRCAPPWVPDELKVKVANAYRYGQEAPGVAAPEGQFDPLPDEPEGKKPPLVLDVKAPMEAARKFAATAYPAADGRDCTLVHHRGAFYAWDRSRYVEAEPAAIRSKVYGFLGGAYVRQRDGSELEPFQPNQNRVGHVIDALQAAVHIDARLEAPAWLDGRNVPAGELIACRNGLLHVPTRTLTPHTAAFFNVNALSFDYDEHAPEPRQWLDFLHSIWPDDNEARDCLQEIVGYLLTHDTSQQKLFLLIGPKRSGKGTIGRVVAELVGTDNAVGPTLGSLATQFGVAPLIGKQVAVIADARLGGRADQHAIAERLLSVSGEDAVTVDRKFRDPYTGKLSTRFLIMSNELPRLADASGALSSRFIIVTMRNSFIGREDPGLTARLLGELPSIFNWALEGLRRLQQRGYFVPPSSSREAVEDLEALTSPIGAFIKECCELDPAAETDTDGMFNAWRQWCGEQGRDRPGSKASFGRDLLAALPALKKAQPRRGDGSRHRVYVGIKLLVDEWGQPVKP